MRRFLTTLLAAAFAMAVPSAQSARAQQAATSADSVLVRSAHTVLDSLAANQTEGVLKQFSSEMRNAFPTADLVRQFWGRIIAQTGSLKELSNPRIMQQQGLRQVVFDAAFENGVFAAAVVYSADGLIAGIAVVPKRT